jgi:hypothetical protein
MDPYFMDWDIQDEGQKNSDRQTIFSLKFIWNGSLGQIAVDNFCRIKC